MGSSETQFISIAVLWIISKGDSEGVLIGSIGNGSDSQIIGSIDSTIQSLGGHT